MTTLHTFEEGAAEIVVRLVLELDDGGGPQLVAKTTESFTITYGRLVFAIARR